MARPKYRQPIFKDKMLWLVAVVDEQDFYQLFHLSVKFEHVCLKKNASICIKIMLNKIWTIKTEYFRLYFLLCCKKKILHWLLIKWFKIRVFVNFFISLSSFSVCANQNHLSLVYSFKNFYSELFKWLCWSCVIHKDITYVFCFNWPKVKDFEDEILKWVKQILVLCHWISK